MTFLSAGFTHLLIDLDDTVYPPEVPIWNIIGERINRYMIEFVGIPEADVVSIREHLFTWITTTNTFTASLMEIFSNPISNCAARSYACRRKSGFLPMPTSPMPKMCFHRWR